MVCCTWRRTTPCAHCRMDWWSAARKRQSAHKRMTATVFSMGNNMTLPPSWRVRHRWEHRMRLTHRLQRLPTESHVSSPRCVRISGKGTTKCCLEWPKKQKKPINIVIGAGESDSDAATNIPMQLAICTIGPSLPRHKPDDTDNIRPTDFTSNVHLPR